jgi:hypothetical protein
MYRVKIVATAGVRVTTYGHAKAAHEALALLAGQKRGDVYLLDAATGQVLRQSLHGPAGKSGAGHSTLCHPFALSAASRSR